MAAKDWKAGMQFVRFVGGRGSVTIYDRKMDFMDCNIERKGVLHHVGLVLCEVWVCRECGLDFIDDGRDRQLAVHAVMHSDEKVGEDDYN